MVRFKHNELKCKNCPYFYYDNGRGQCSLLESARYILASKNGVFCEDIKLIHFSYKGEYLRTEDTTCYFFELLTYDD